ncbi:MAG: hypothetical protein ABUK01_17960 [Leptospirales bacterium]
MSDLKQFEFNDDTITYFKEAGIIPLQFYNKSGQVLIHKKDNAAESEVDNLIKFQSQGIYYHKDDEDKLHRKSASRRIPNGLSDTRLLTKETTKVLSEDVKSSFQQMQQSSIDGLTARKMKNNVNDVFAKFEKQPDAMMGLVNILELMGSDSEMTYDMEIAVKRTVVAMALKTRGVIYQSATGQAAMQEDMNNLLMSAMLCDVSYLKMKIPTDTSLTPDHRNYISNHPLISYLMLAHEPEISREVKRNVLLHHRPFHEDKENNNYPQHNVLLQKLSKLYQEYSKDNSKLPVARSVANTIQDLQNRPAYDENANILALASEFASLTTKTAWREAFDPLTATKLIINNSYFTYPGRILREFLDSTAISLCDNKKIINNGDFLVLSAESLQGSSHMEIVKVSEIDRHQSRPQVRRIAFISPKIQKTPKLRLTGIDTSNITLDKRKAHYHLENDNTRKIVYCVDEKMDAELHEKLMEISSDVK